MTWEGQVGATYNLSCIIDYSSIGWLRKIQDTEKSLSTIHNGRIPKLLVEYFMKNMSDNCTSLCAQDRCRSTFEVHCIYAGVNCVWIPNIIQKTLLVS